MLELLTGKDLTAYEEACAEVDVPSYMAKGLYNYVEHRIEPGGFAVALLRNDFYETVMRADSNNILALAGWACILGDCLPSDCWGSAEKLRAWLGQMKGKE